MGPRTNLSFHQWVLNNDVFRLGNYDLTFVGEYFHPDKLIEDDTVLVMLAGALISHLRAEPKKTRDTTVSSGNVSLWRLFNERLLNSYR